MRVSLNWLREYVDVDVAPEELAGLFNFSGTKVESLHQPGRDLSGVVVAEVLNITKHPDADNLILVDVTTGDGSQARVVCGAHNFAVGARVPYAAVGARLGEMKIGERNIRGLDSQGMLCSGAELGVSNDASGILLLPANAPLGNDIVEVLRLDDAIFQLEVTPNRGDVMSMIGVAREAAALLRKELRLPAAEPPPSEADNPVSVQIDDTGACPRYLARYIDGVRVGPSPPWLVSRLVTAGVRPISNVVDITNYVLLETGQPLHAFDSGAVSDQSIVVRRAVAGEKLTTLDGVDRELDSEDLVIADPQRALAIAGVMGGAGSEVSYQTTAVILESAYFDHATVSLTARRHGLLTEASVRFERKVDPENVPFAAARAAALMADHAAGQVARKVVDEYPEPFETIHLQLRPQRTSDLLGIEIEPDVQARHLRSIRLGAKRRGDVIEVDVPSFRSDLEREADLIEEVARLEGFDRLPATLPAGRAGGLEEEQSAQRRVARTLATLGLTEAWTTSFAAPADLDALRLDAGHPARRMVELANPMHEGATALRSTLLPGLLRAVARNIAHQVPGLALFEIAHTYEPSEEDLPNESLVLAAVFSGVRYAKGWRQEQRAWDFFGAKGVVQGLLDGLRLGEQRWEAVGAPPFHLTRAAHVSVAGSALGVLGEIHPEICAGFDVPEGTVALEFALESVFSELPGRVIVTDPPRFPAVYLDLAVVVEARIPAQRLLEVIRKAGAPELADARLFDLYRGDQIAPGRKSLAIALELRSPNRTLTDEEAQAVRERIVRALAERTGAELRS